MQRILMPPGKDELALTPAMMGEFRLMDGIFDDSQLGDPRTFQLLPGAPSDDGAPGVLDPLLASLQKGLVALLLQKNATRNRQYEALHAVAALDDVPFPRLAEAERSLRAPQDGGIEWSWIYNPIGRLMLSVATPSFGDYKRRLVDTDGLRR